MADYRSSRPVRPQGRTASSKGAQAQRKRRPFRRLFPTLFLVLGLTTGLVISTVFGIYVVYAEMMSRVTYQDTEVRYDRFYDIPNLAYREEDLSLDSDLLGSLDEDFDEFLNNLEKDSASGTQIPGQEGSIALKPMDGVENILLFGIDTASYSGRSDVIMVISINHNTRKISIVSLMRAMYVKIGISKHDWGLLNAAYSYGGPGLAIRTVENNFGIPIKGFVAFNFNSFVNIVDAIGGVTLNLTSAEARILGLPAGTNRLTGRQALSYARIRKIDDDFHRNQRQRNVIDSILNEMASNGGSSAYKAMSVILANTYTNLNLTGYLSKLPTYLSYQRKQLQLPAMSETRMYYVKGQEVWWIDRVKTHKRLTNFLSE